jgi:hypothetical protein
MQLERSYFRHLKVEKNRFTSLFSLLDLQIKPLVLLSIPVDPNISMYLSVQRYDN